MKEDMFRKGWVVSVIIMLIGIGVAPIVNANVNRILPTTKNNGEIEEGDFVEVTCQVSTLKGAKQVVKHISKDKLDKITNLANDVNALLDGKNSVIDLRDKISALAVELKSVDLLPQRMNIDDVVDLMMNSLVRSKQLSNPLEKLLNKRQINNDDKRNSFNFIFGVGKKLCYGINILRHEYIEKLLDLLYQSDIIPYKTLSNIIAFIYLRPKMLFGLGAVGFLMGNASVTTVGLRGIKRAYGEVPVIVLVGFLGLKFSTRRIGFIFGFSLFSDMIVIPDESR
ncbi:MAG: hypothetical protein JSW60_09455 [Thermoplasmatales archaeon]|nr:MAG: hypothetical protein JSW60_09455 [Thermoplasmatales archaeon]